MSKYSNKRVLVADDEIGVRRFLKALIGKIGCTVDIAENGHIAFRMATQEEYDLIMMDIVMPDWNGLDAIRSLKMIQPERKIIVMSAYLNDELLEELKQEENVIAVFMKPVDIDPLTEAIEDALSNDRD